MLGVATLILVTSLMNGIREEMLANFLGLGGHATLYGQGRVLSDADALADTLKADGALGVVQAVPRIEGQVMATSRGRALGAQVIGLDARHLMEKHRIADHIEAGSLEGFGAQPGIVIGQRLMENLGLRAGDDLTLISPEGRSTIAGRVPRVKAYPILAAFKTGMHEVDASLILMPRADARIYFALPVSETGSATTMEINFATPEEAAGRTQALKAWLADRGWHGRIYDWQQTHGSVFSALKIQRNTMTVILTLIIVVAAFTIISGLIMLVQDKQHDIAILRTFGATRGMILRVFLISGMSIGLIGTLLGAGLGILAAAYIDAIRKAIEAMTGQEILVEDIYFLSTLPTRTDPAEVLGIVLATLAICFIATLYPAWKASSYHPAEALRYG